MSKSDNFYEWLAEEKNRKSPRGALAAVVARDQSFPKDVASLEALLAHLRTKEVDGPMLAAARIAWKAYTASAPVRR